jgi:hypothetical protein
MAERAVALYRMLKDSLQLARALIGLGHSLSRVGRRDEADQAISESLTLARGLGSLY